MDQNLRPKIKIGIIGGSFDSTIAKTHFRAMQATNKFKIVCGCFSRKKNKNITVGYSDHTVGDLALKSAYTLGAQILEFHFTDTRKNQTFRDHKVSLNLHQQSYALYQYLNAEEKALEM